MPDPRTIWEVDVRRPLDASTVDQLNEELGVEFFGLADPHESTVGQRVLERGEDGMVVLLVRRWPEHGGFSFEMISSAPSSSQDQYGFLHERCTAIASDRRPAERSDALVRLPPPDPDRWNVEIGSGQSEVREFAELIIMRTRVAAEGRLAALGELLANDRIGLDLAVARGRSAWRDEAGAGSRANPERTGRAPLRGVSWVLGENQPATRLAQLALVVLGTTQFLLFSELTGLPAGLAAAISAPLIGLAGAVGSLSARLASYAAGGRREPMSLVGLVVSLAALVFLTALAYGPTMIHTYTTNVLAIASVGVSVLIVLCAYLAYGWTKEAVQQGVDGETRDRLVHEQLQTALSARAGHLQQFVAEAESELPRFRAEAIDAVLSAFMNLDRLPPAELWDGALRLPMPDWVYETREEIDQTRREIVDLAAGARWSVANDTGSVVTLTATDMGQQRGTPTGIV